MSRVLWLNRRVHEGYEWGLGWERYIIMWISVYVLKGKSCHLTWDTWLTENQKAIWSWSQSGIPRFRRDFTACWGRLRLESLTKGVWKYTMEKRRIIRRGVWQIFKSSGLNKINPWCFLFYSLVKLILWITRRETSAILNLFLIATSLAM